MKKHGIGSRVLALLLVLAMVLPMVPLQASAAVGDLSNVSTGLTGDIDKADTISLPIQILDYEADGMLFEYAEAYADATGREVGASKTAADFGATWAADFASKTSISNVTTSEFFETSSWGYTTRTLDTSNSYASYMRVTWAKNSTQAPHTFNGSRAGTIMPNDLNLSMNNARYLVLVYRSNIADGKIGFFVERANADRNNTNNRVGDFELPASGNNWSYKVYDLKQGNLANTWSSYGNAKAIWTTLPMNAKGEYMDIAHVALFANAEQAEAFGEYALTDGSNRGDNRGFGLLRGSRNQDSNGTAANGYGGAFDGIFVYEGAKDTIAQITTYDDAVSVDFSTIDNLGYTLLGTFRDQGIANVGLLESGLVNGKPVYKQEVVTYLANLLKHSLEIPERTSDGWKNYRYISSDLAADLRSRITGGLGTYPTGDAAKGLIGTWEDCQGNIHTYYDAAYFLLNSIFIDDSYNIPQDSDNNEDYYDYLVLSAGTDKETGDKVYVFDGGFSTSADPEQAQMAIDYNTMNNNGVPTNTIQNNSAAGKAHFVYQGEETTTLNPFLPITDKNNAEGQTVTPYYQDDGVINGIKKKTGKDTLYQRDYNFAMYSSGQFVYHADEELFFDFEGDDDVYLFINGELVMDIGSAHSIDGVRIELNDYVNAAKAGTLGSAERNAKLNLLEGNTYSFDFYYMERHSYGSNMRIMTNIRVTDPSMVTEKSAWQDGEQIDYGSVVDKNKVIEYGFSLTNNGQENLFNLTFTDNDIGVTLDPQNGLTITGERVYDANGGTLEVTDLTATVYGPGYEDIVVTFPDNETLKDFLAGLESDKVIQTGMGLWIGSAVSIRGIGYKLSDDQIKKGVFDNTVLTTATNSNNSETLYGQDNMRVFVPADPMYYEWAEHTLNVSKTKLIEDILAAANQPDNLLNGKAPDLTTGNVNKIEFVTSGGNPITYDNVKMDSSYNLTIQYPKAGSYVFYVKVTYNSSKNNVVVPVLVNVTDVADSVFVLDYGLKADLAENGGKELFKNDVVTVPGRSTKHSVLAVGSDGAYSPNEITFTKADDNKLEGKDGTFTVENEGQSLIYTPTDFMDELDTIQIAVNVYESDLKEPSKITGTLDINNEVEMYKSVTVLPATVVYYEDDFPAIEYITQAENTFTRLGESTDESQGVDQEENYGHDDTYADGSNTDRSAGTLTTITIAEDGPVAKFTFKGTGFELISRTNAYDAATIEIAVFEGEVENVSYNKDSKTYTGDGNAPLYLLPVINEFDNGGDGGTEEIYQVPVIRLDQLELDTYTVVIGGVPAYDFSNWTDYTQLPPVIPTKLYIDGLRIFQPMGESNEYYDTDENGAVFQELRDLIVDGTAAVATYDGENLGVSSGTTTWTENRNGQYYDDVYENVDDIPVYEGNKVEDVNAYLLMGPNNEVYMDGTMVDAALAFYLTESGAENAVHQLQIAVHAVDQGLFYGAGETGMHAPIYYGVQNGGAYAWEPLVTVTSATEQYYTIDYTKCPVVDGKYQVVIKVDIEGSDYTTAMASYTSLKLTNLELQDVDGNGEAATLRYNDGMLEEWVNGEWVPVIDKETGEAAQTASYPAFEALSSQMRVSVLAQPDTDTTPEPTDPEPTDPEPTDPEPTDPEPTDPEPTDPEPTDPEPTDPATTFTDVPEDSFYYDAVAWAVENGITTGTSESTFSPDRKVTRAEAVTFLWRAAGEPEPAAENPFTDVSEDAFYYKAVLWAVENGITNGVDAEHFAPLNLCNRAQVVTFLHRAAGGPDAFVTEHPFTDVAEGDFYYGAMLWAVENGITTGISETAFGPNAECNRAQIVTFLYRAA